MYLAGKYRHVWLRGVALYAAFWRSRRMKKKSNVAKIPTPASATIAIPATARWLSGEESPELPPLGELVLPEQEGDWESLDVILTMPFWALSCHAQADTLNVPRS